MGDLLGDLLDLREGDRLPGALSDGTGLEVLREMAGTLLRTLPRLLRLSRVSVDSWDLAWPVWRRGLGRRDLRPLLLTLRRDPCCRPELPCSLLLLSPLSLCGDGSSTFS